MRIIIRPRDSSLSLSINIKRFRDLLDAIEPILEPDDTLELERTEISF